MKKLVSIAAGLMLAALSVHALPQTLIQNLSGTNLTYTITGNTNVNYTTNINGVVIAASTNYYNLAGGLGQTTITNGWWPSAGWAPLGGTATVTGGATPVTLTGGGGYPNTLYAPYKTSLLNFGSTLMSTNNSVTATLSFAGSVDGVFWQSNILTWVVTPATNQKTVSAYTNWVPGSFNYLCLQNITCANANLTNTLLQVNGIPGF